MNINTWKYSLSPERCLVFNADGTNHCGRTFDTGLICEVPSDSIRAEKVAVLIASAPHLYAVLNELVKQCEMGMHASVVNCGMLDIAKDTLRKATLA